MNEDNYPPTMQNTVNVLDFKIIELEEAVVEVDYVLDPGNTCHRMIMDYISYLKTYVIPDMNYCLRQNIDKLDEGHFSQETLREFRENTQRLWLRADKIHREVTLLYQKIGPVQCVDTNVTVTRPSTPRSVSIHTSDLEDADLSTTEELNDSEKLVL